MRMQIRGAGPHPDVSVSGATITIGDVTIDAAARQDESAVDVALRQEGSGSVTEGGSGHQIAAIQIPPTRYEEVDTGETDDDGEPVIERQAVALDPDEVLVTLWTVRQ